MNKQSTSVDIGKSQKPKDFLAAIKTTLMLPNIIFRYNRFIFGG